MEKPSLFKFNFKSAWLILKSYLIRNAFWVGMVLCVLYFLSVAIFPWVQGGWVYVQEVLDRWQTASAAVLTLLSSIIFFKTTEYRENEQRKRRFIAAKVFLPQVLSNLTIYCDHSGKFLIEAWENLDSLEKKGMFEPFEIRLSELPKLPESYVAIFDRCIEHGEPEVGEYLAKILERLQVCHARLEDFKMSIDQQNSSGYTSRNLEYYLEDFLELKSLIDLLFHFARGSNNSLRCATPDRGHYENALVHFFFQQRIDHPLYTKIQTRLKKNSFDLE